MANSGAAALDKSRAECSDARAAIKRHSLAGAATATILLYRPARPAEQEARVPMTIIQEFRKFITRGNVLELAVGVVIGAAFGRIMTSFTENVLMPLIGWMFGDVDFSNWFLRLGPIPASYEGAPDNYAKLKEAGVLMIGYGDVLTQVVDFLLLGAALFFLVKIINRAMDAIEREKKLSAEGGTDSATPKTPDAHLEMLHEIREELRSLRHNPQSG
jgi:large conductance mechanosensitive channel